MGRSVGPSTGRWVDLSVGRWVCGSVGRTADRPMGWSVGRRIGRWIGGLMGGEKVHWSKQGRKPFACESIARGLPPEGNLPLLLRFAREDYLGYA